MPPSALAACRSKISPASSNQVVSPELVAVVDARRGARRGQRVDLRRQVRRPGRLSGLVADDGHRVALAGQPDHRPHEARPVLPVQPGGPHHVAGVGQRLQDRPLARQLGPAVRGARSGGGVLGVGSAGVAREDVVRGDLHQRGTQRRARRGQVRRAVAVVPQRLRLVGLGVVHGGPGGAVDHDRGTARLQRRRHGGGVGDVQVRPAQAGGLLAPAGQQGGQVPAEHPGGPGDQPAAQP